MKDRRRRGIVIGDKRYSIVRRDKAPSKKELRAGGTTDKNNKKTVSRGQQVFRRLVAFFVCFCVLIGVTGLSVMATWMLQSPEIDLGKFDYAGATTVYDLHDEYYQELQTSEVREVVSIRQIPELVSLAFVSIEDQRFYSHWGVDVRGTLKAVIGVLTSGSTEGMGGSTITQQLIKQTHLSSATSVKRKVMEWKMSVQLENTIPKREILEAYLNKINLSEAWGIQSAAKVFFGLDVSELSISQAAVLASIMKAPTYYGPYIYDQDEDGFYYLRKTTDRYGNVIPYHNENNKQRAIDIVYKMYELGHISERERDIAEADIRGDNIGLKIPEKTNNYTYFTDAVYTQVLDDLVEKYNYTYTDAADLVANGGLCIYSTVDSTMQDILDEMCADDSNFPSQSYTAERASIAASEQSGNEVEYVPQIGGAVVQTSTGYVVGIVGGRGKSGNLVLNRGLCEFQTGSSTKPVTVYAPAVDSGMVTLADKYMDVPIDWNGWDPGNSGGGTSGVMTVRTALTQSINIVAVQVQLTIGPEVSMEYGRKFGLTFAPWDDNAAALALGGYSYGQTPIAMASAFTTFANGGTRKTPTFYRYVTDSNGVMILQTEQETVKVISPQTAWLITDVLKDAVRGGTVYLSIPNQDFAGKTGTTDGLTNCWFCGYTKDYAAAFWMGYDVQKVVAGGRTYYLDLGLYGGSSRGPAFFVQNTFRKYYESLGYPEGHFDPMPSGIVRGADYLIQGTHVTSWEPPKVKISWCKETHLLPNETCEIEEVEIYDWASGEIPGGGKYKAAGGYVGKDGTHSAAPTEICDVIHVSPEPPDPPVPPTPPVEPEEPNDGEDGEDPASPGTSE